MDADRAIYHMVPISGRLRDETVFYQTSPSSLLHDRAAKRLTFCLGETIDQATLLEALGRSVLPVEPVTIDDLTLPGVSMQLGRVRLEFSDDALVVTLLN